MINTGFVHALDEEMMLESAYQQDLSDIQHIVCESNTMLMQAADMKKLGIFTEAKELYLTESVSDAVTKLGEKIIQMIEDMKKFIKDIFNRIKTNNFNKKDVDGKIDMIMKHDPSLGERVKKAVDMGDLKIADIKSLSEYYKSIDGILDEIERGKLDENSIKGKLAKAKKKLEDGRTIGNIAAIVGVVATGTTIVISAHKIRQIKYDNLKVYSEQAATKHASLADRCASISKKIQESKDRSDAEKQSVMHILCTVMAEEKHESCGEIMTSTRAMNKLQDAAWKVVDILSTKFTNVKDRNDKLDKKIKEYGDRSDAHTKASDRFVERAKKEKEVRDKINPPKDDSKNGRKPNSK